MDNIHIFDNITSAELDKMMVCFKSEIKSFPAHEQLLSSSAGTSQIGVLLSGEADLVKYDFDGYRSILEHLSKQDIFGHLLLLSLGETPMEVVSCTACKVLFFDYSCLIKRCSHACTHHSILVNNVLQILSVKTRQLHTRLDILSQRSIRGKLLTYFRHLAYEHQSESFLLPFTLNSMADYLFIDRSAMLREMKKMREEGLIQSKGRQITLQLHE